MCSFPLLHIVSPIQNRVQSYWPPPSVLEMLRQALNGVLSVSTSVCCSTRFSILSPPTASVHYLVFGTIGKQKGSWSPPTFHGSDDGSIHGATFSYLSRPLPHRSSHPSTRTRPCLWPLPRQHCPTHLVTHKNVRCLSPAVSMTVQSYTAPSSSSSSSCSSSSLSSPQPSKWSEEEDDDDLYQ